LPRAARTRHAHEENVAQVRVLTIYAELDLLRRADVAVAGRARDCDERAPAAAATAGGRALGAGGAEGAESRVCSDDGERPVCAAGVRSDARRIARADAGARGWRGRQGPRSVWRRRWARCGIFRREVVIVVVDVGSDPGRGAPAPQPS
jgi:hypothetical protein